MPGYAHPKWSYQLVENFDVYLHVKNKLQIHFFLGILHFKVSFNLINQNFVRYGIGGEISIIT